MTAAKKAAPKKAATKEAATKQAVPKKAALKKAASKAAPKKAAGKKPAGKAAATAVVSGKVPVYDAKGKPHGDVELPPVFLTPLRPDLIQKAVRVSQANRRQRYGASPVAGERHATASAGKGLGISRVPRLTQGRRGALAPGTVGGRRAHPPEARTDWSLRMNQKERRLAIASALAATAHPEAVASRGHRVSAVRSFPIVVDDAVTALTRTQDAAALLDALGMGDDLARARDGRHIRAGMGKLRGRKYRTPKSLLLVVADGRADAFANLAGVDVVAAGVLGTEHLAPGGHAGRLTVFTKGAIARLKEVYA